MKRINIVLEFLVVVIALAATTAYVNGSDKPRKDTKREDKDIIDVVKKDKMFVVKNLSKGYSQDSYCFGEVVKNVRSEFNYGINPDENELKERLRKCRETAKLFFSTYF